MQSPNTASFTSWSCTSALSGPRIPNIPVRYLPIHLTTERTAYLDSSLWPLAFSTTVTLAPEREWESWSHPHHDPKPFGGVLVYSGSYNKIPSRRFIQQKLIFSWFWRLETQDLGVGRYGFFWGLSPWLADSHLPPCSHHACSSVCTQLVRTPVTLA